MHSPLSKEAGAAHSAGFAGPSFAMPRQACDCHMHVFDSAFALAEGAVLAHADAGIAAYRGLQRRLGLARNILVQPSSYGLDNRLLCRTLAQLGEAARGVAVVDDQVGTAQLDALARSGVTGVRFNLVQRGATRVEMLGRVAQRVQPLGWHIQLHMLPGDLVAHQRTIDALPVPVVIDHIARFASQPEMQPRVQQSLRQLLANGKTWLKLSGAYLASAQGAPPFDDLTDFVGELVRDYPQRLLWGSDWPHATEAVKPDDGALLDLLGQWAPDAALRHQILELNPALLYGF